MELTVEGVACTVCGCVCDDLRITLADGRISRAEGACRLAEPWFLGQDTRQPSVALIEGQPAALDTALDRAVEILGTARSPLVYGLSRSSTAGQRAAVALADRIGATIDTTASLCHAPSVMALQEVGESTCSLGEVKNREADACLLLGSEGVTRFSPATVAHLERIPTITLDYPTVESVLRPTVRFTTAVYGVHRPGTAYRMDEVPIPLRAFLPSAYPTDADVLKGIEERLCRRP